MKKIKTNQLLIPTVYLLGITAFAFCLVAITKGVKEYSLNDYTTRKVFQEQIKEGDQNVQVIEHEPIEYIDNTEQVINTNNIIKPYTAKDITLYRAYYDEQADAVTQQKSIIFYGNTYMQNNGSEYTSKKQFDVVSIINGTVESITKDENLGYIVTVKHENNLQSIYSYLESVEVKEGTTINKGDIIGKSGKNTLEQNDDYILHFEVTHNGKNINPESLYTMKVEDFR